MNRQLLESWGLACCERFDEAPLADAARLRLLEDKHSSLPNREGAVVYIVVRDTRDADPEQTARVALIYKWKNAWYVLVRALREKFAQRATETQIARRVAELYCHHADEAAVVAEHVSFYRWVQQILPPEQPGFGQSLRGSWVSLRLAHAAYRDGAADWALHLAAERAGVEVVTSEQIAQFIQHAVATPERAAGPGASGGQSAAAAAGSAAGGETELGHPAVGLTVVLVRGLQGSGKSTLCRALRDVLGGRWVNQDEVGATCRKPKNKFLREVESAVAERGLRYLFVDKIHTQRQHRDDVLAAVAAGRLRRERESRATPVHQRVAVALLSLHHPSDDDSSSQWAQDVCIGRVERRGLGHLSLVPEGCDVNSVIERAGAESEQLDDEERCRYDLVGGVPLTVSPEGVLEAALGLPPTPSEKCQF